MRSGKFHQYQSRITIYDFIHGNQTYILAERSIREERQILLQSEEPKSVTHNATGKFLISSFSSKSTFCNTGNITDRSTAVTTNIMQIGTIAFASNTH